MRPIDTIIIHCSGTLPKVNVTTSSLWTFHVQVNGWNHIGYHYLIKTDGRIYECRPIEMVGAGVAGHNQGAIHICYEGGLSQNPGQSAVGADTRTDEQRYSLLLLIAQLLLEYPSVSKIVGHNYFTKAKECPCFDAAADYSWMLKYAYEITFPSPIIIPYEK